MSSRYYPAFLLCVSVLTTTLAYSQSRQNDQWHFGFNASVDFSSGAPVALAGSAIFTSEGCASVADRFTGNLLFYTNGLTIWDRSNQPMPNGSGLLGGSPALTSSTTAARIVPLPGNPDQYYVFTVDEQFGLNGLRLNLVDMTLNGGLGDVVPGQKNVLISNDNIAEKLDYAPLPNATGYWLVARQVIGNQYMAWQITSAGISATPVISNAGTSTSNGAGYLKFNQDHTMLANAVVTGFVDVLSFDNTTGQISNIVTLPVPIGSSVYGVEFSPSGRFLYVSNFLDGLFQFDLNAPNVAASRQTVATVLATALQLGPDCRIYLTDGGLSAIPNPDLPAPACGYLAGAVNTQPGGSSYGLPMKVIFLDEYFAQISPSGSSFCAGAAIPFELTGLSLYPQDILWNFGDPASGAADSASAAATAQVAHLYSQPGQYVVRAVFEYECSLDTAFYNITVSSCNPGSSNCIEFQCTGSPQQWIVPSGVDTVYVKLWGAAGGGGPDPVNNAGGGGGYTEFSLPVVPGDELQIVVGCGGQPAVGHIGGAGGWPAGGNGGSGNRVETVSGTLTDVGGSGGGGGLSLVRLLGSQNAILGIAGAGGGGSFNREGGGGGGLNAEYTATNNPFNVFGFGGTQTAGGAPGSNTLCPNPVFGTAGGLQQGGTGATDLGSGNAERTSGGGGGDGHYGGGGGSSHDGCFGVGSAGGGGSGFVCSTCPGLIGNTITAGFSGAPANNGDPLLSTYPGTATGVVNSAGGNGLVSICFESTPCTTTTSGITVIACSSYVAPNGAVLTFPGLYIITIPNAAGCDSVISIFLSFIGTITTPPTTASACGSYTAPWGATYTQSGFYSDTLTSSLGCDSIVSVDLTINTGFIGTPIIASACSSYTAPWGATYTQSGFYADTLTSSSGCDSILSLDLTITGAFTGTPIIANTCSTYTAPWGTNYSQTGLYSVAFTTANGCDSILSLDLTVNDPPTVALTATPDVCGAGIGAATALASGNGPFVYAWSDGSSSEILSGLTPGNYSLTLTDGNGCTAAATVAVGGTPAASVSATASSFALILGDSVQLTAIGAVSYQWSPVTGLSCTDCPAPTATPAATTDYVVTGTDVNGCTATATVRIAVDIICSELFVPNMFSPDGAGPAVNERWCVLSNCIVEMELVVYDRWGQVIFRSTDPEFCWDGKKEGNEVMAGAYAYRLSARQLNGKEIIRTGSVTLVR